MKKIASILLISLLLFNWFGYQVVIAYMESQETLQLEARLDENNYDESQLISIKIPMRYVPYANSTPAFERVDGQIEIGGVPYKYVKRRLFNDSLEVLCIPNQTAIKWKDAKNELFRFVNDLQHEKKSQPQSPVTVKNISTDNFIQQEAFFINALRTVVYLEYRFYSDRVTSHNPPIDDHPPQLA